MLQHLFHEIRFWIHCCLYCDIIGLMNTLKKKQFCVLTLHLTCMHLCFKLTLHLTWMHLLVFQVDSSSYLYALSCVSGLFTGALTLMHACYVFSVCMLTLTDIHLSVLTVCLLIFWDWCTLVCFQWVVAVPDHQADEACSAADSFNACHRPDGHHGAGSTDHCPLGMSQQRSGVFSQDLHHLCWIWKPQVSPFQREQG